MTAGNRPRPPVDASTGAKLDRLVAERQKSWRALGVAAGIVHGGSVQWFSCVGAASASDLDTAPGPDTAFAIGSNTKTFTASLIMKLRDAGTVDLDAPVGEYLTELAATQAGIPIRQLLSHSSGLQREPHGDIWDDLEIPTVEQLLADSAKLGRVLPPRLRWHYSNQAYALLGEVAARGFGCSWFEAVRTQLLEPLGMTATTDTPPPGRATGYYTDPFADRVHEEKWPAMNAFAAAGGLWSTVSDLARWTHFLARGADGVLSAPTLEEMSQPEIMTDTERWSEAFGLGLLLERRDDRVFVGHSGGMPGFVTGMMVRRSDDLGAVVLTNSSSGTAPIALAVELASLVLDEQPSVPLPWRPAEPVPDEIEPLLGRWWTEGAPLALSWRDGALQLRFDAASDRVKPAVFERIDDDTYRVVSGHEQGELLRIERAADGSVSRLKLATYPVTREPQTFG